MKLDRQVWRSGIKFTIKPKKLVLVATAQSVEQIRLYCPLYFLIRLEWRIVCFGLVSTAESDKGISDPDLILDLSLIPPLLDLQSEI